jgi:serine protease Do
LQTPELFERRTSAWGQTANRGVEASANEGTRGSSHASDLLRQFNTSLVTLTKQVTPAVVQITVTSYGPIDHSSESHDVALIARQHGIGSGVIVDRDGYIVTNAHVVEGAQRIRVTLTSATSGAPFATGTEGEHRVLDAKLVGADKDIDLALIKVDAKNLPILNLAPTRSVHPGELVLAVGSPEGLQSSVTMGVVSSVARQPDSDQPAVYIQTDAPINPGNSGGPLIDIDGYVIGLNTMILSQSGGSEGLGFAIPACTVQFVYENLRKYGHVHRTEIQANAQEITPTLAEGLGLSQDWGVIISDVTSGGPAAAGGLRPGDVVHSVDGHPVTALPDLATALYLHSPKKSVLIDVLRGSGKVSLIIPAQQDDDKPNDLADLIDPEKLIGRLGVFVRDFNDIVPSVLRNSVRIASGVVVVAQSPELNSYTSNLRAGDILHTFNGTPIESVQQLRSQLQGTKNGHAVVLQIERAGKLQYIAFDWGD